MSAVDLRAPSRWRTPPVFRVLTYFGFKYKRTWRGSLTISFLYPLLYLAAMGVGLGSLVDQHVHLVDQVSYRVFVAPGLLAATAMQIGANEATFPVMTAIKWEKTYYAMLATPLTANDVLFGHLTWMALRVLFVSVIYAVIMAIFGAALSPFAMVAVVAAVLLGMAFAAPIAAYAATLENDAGFSTIFRMLLIPMFLFSGTFFPVSQLPGWLQVIAYATPLYHGVALCRDLSLGQISPVSDLLHGLYLLTLTAIGILASIYSYRKRLVV